MGWTEWGATVEVEPSIYASDFSRLGDQLGALVEAGVRVFHFDAGDGHFIPEITSAPFRKKDLQKCQNRPTDIRSKSSL